MDEVIELRVHGVSGTPPEQLLDTPLVEQVAGDAKAGFYRPRLPEERRDPRDPSDEVRSTGPLLEGYAWGGLTSGAPTRALWLLLLPFTLTNVAPRLRPRGPAFLGGKSAINLWTLWFTARMLAVSMTALIVAALAGVSDDLFAWQCGNNGRTCDKASPRAVMRPLLDLSAEHRLALGMLVPFAALALLWLVSGRTIDNYESVPITSWETKKLKAHLSSAIEPSLDSAWMWRNEEQVRRLRHLHLMTGFGTALWVGTYPFGNWDGLRIATAAALAAYIVTMLCIPAFTGREQNQTFYWLNIGVWVLLTIEAIFALAALVWGHPLPAHNGTDGLPGFAGTALLIFGVQLALVLGFAVSVIVMAVRGRAPGNPNRTSHSDDPTLPRALWNCSAIVLAALALFLGAVFSAGIYVFATAWLSTGSLKPGFGAVTRSAAAFHVPTTIREADRAYTVAVVLLVVLVLAVLVALALNRVGRLLHLRSWPNEEYRARLVAAYGAPAVAADPDRAKTVAKTFWLARQVDFAHRLLAAVVAAGIVIVAFFTTLLITSHGRVTGNCILRWHNYDGAGSAVQPCGSGLVRSWLFDGWLSARSLEGTGAYLAVLTLVLLVALGAAAFRVDRTRRSVGILWDLASFWPRSAHPFAAPCYAERAVPDLVTRLYWYTGEQTPGRKVVLAAHSQGTVISMATLLQLDKIDRTEPADEAAAPIPKMIPSIAFMSFGCVLRRLYARYFPAYFSVTTIGYLRTILSAEGADAPRWRNLWRYSDYLGGQVTAGPPPRRAVRRRSPTLRSRLRAPIRDGHATLAIRGGRRRTCTRRTGTTLSSPPRWASSRHNCAPSDRAQCCHVHDTPPKRAGATVHHMTQTIACAAAPPTTATLPPQAPDRTASLAVWVRQPWMVRVGNENVLIRGTTPRDFGAVAGMHTRCTPRSLLERYRSGGKPPSAVAIERLLRRTLAFVACTARGDVVAIASAASDVTHGSSTADIGVLVEDTWQRRGLGREMITHLAAAAYVCGYSELITYTGPSTLAATQLLTDVGRTYAVLDATTPHLHTYLSESTTLGLGAIREHLAC